MKRRIQGTFSFAYKALKVMTSLGLILSAGCVAAKLASTSPADAKTLPMAKHTAVYSKDTLKQKPIPNPSIEKAAMYSELAVRKVTGLDQAVELLIKQGVDIKEVLKQNVVLGNTINAMAISSNRKDRKIDSIMQINKQLRVIAVTEQHARITNDQQHKAEKIAEAANQRIDSKANFWFQVCLVYGFLILATILVFLTHKIIPYLKRKGWDLSTT